MVKFFTILICLTVVAFTSCNEQQKPIPIAEKPVADSTDALKVGGVYLFQNKDKTFGIEKILVIDDFAVHVRYYKNSFTTKPDSINTADFKIMIGHAPLDKKGFLLNKPLLLKVEDVKDSELEGYKLYMEEMSK